MTTDTTIDEIVDGLHSGNRRILAHALSVVESTTDRDRHITAELLRRLTDSPLPTSRRIGLTGSPGVGKSTLMEAFGMRLIERGHRVAVLAVDPSSHRTGGSILGDKVRMQRLSVHDNAFVRPSPSRKAFGGASAGTRDAITVCEAAGFDTVIVETVGVGQNETETSELVDLFLLLVLPTAGDDVQGIKRGIMEVADAILVTKADLDPQQAAQAQAMYRMALQLMLPATPQWTTTVSTVSALSNNGLDTLMDTVDAFFDSNRQPVIDQIRAEQRLHGFDRQIQQRLATLIMTHNKLGSRLAKIRQQVFQEALPATTAVEQFLHDVSIDLPESP